MGIITKIEDKPDRGKCWIDVDNQFCASLDKVLVENLGLTLGSYVDINYLKDRDRNNNVVIDIKDLGEKNKQGEETVTVYLSARKKDGSNIFKKIRKRIFDTLNNTIDLEIGKIITYDDLSYANDFIWKVLYQGLWEEEKYRIDKVKQYIKYVDKDDKIIIDTIGFGADTNEFIKNHLDEQGKPDLALRLRNSEESFMYIEVTGTSKNLRHGSGYWIRPDKLRYYKSHSEDNIWVMLHYQKPTERIVIIKPNNAAEYIAETEVINGAREYYVKFYDNSEEVKTSKDFEEEIEKFLI